MTWIKLAWSNRARIIEAAKTLHWSRRTWMRVLGLAAVAVGVYLAATYGYLSRYNPTAWSGAQWAQLIVNLTGFGILYVAMRSWWGRQDEVWDEVGQLREQVDELRVALYEHEHDIVANEGEELPLARVLPVVDRILTDELPAVPPSRELVTVQQEFGGRTFSFKASADQ